MKFFLTDCTAAFLVFPCTKDWAPGCVNTYEVKKIEGRKAQIHHSRDLGPTLYASPLHQHSQVPVAC